MSEFPDFFDHEQSARLRLVLEQALNTLPPDERAIRQRRIANGEAPAGITLRGGMDERTGLPYVQTDSESGYLHFDWGGELLCAVDPDALDPTSTSLAESN
jgi:hypothetical protein